MPGQVTAAGLTNVECRQANIFELPFQPESFDHAFVCFVLEHLPRPVSVRRQGCWKPGGTITVIEGDRLHLLPIARMSDRCGREQRRAGAARHDRPRVVSAPARAGYRSIACRRMVYVDSSKPELVEASQTFTAMIERDSSLAAGIAEPDADRGRDSTAPPSRTACSAYVLQGRGKQRNIMNSRTTDRARPRKLVPSPPPCCRVQAEHPEAWKRW